MFLQYPPSKNLFLYCPGHAGVKGNDGADRLAGKATITSGLLLGRSEVLRDRRHYLRAQSQAITPQIIRRREAWKAEGLDDLHWKDERGPSSIKRTSAGTVSMTTLWKLLRGWMGHIIMGFSERKDTILSGTEVQRLSIH